MITMTSTQKQQNTSQNRPFHVYQMRALIGTISAERINTSLDVLVQYW